MTVAKAESLKWTRTCIRCGKKMVGVASNKKLCDSCLRIRQIERRILSKTMSGKRIGWA